MARAKTTDRLIFGVIVIPQQPGFQTVLSRLAADPKAVAVLHESYVPVLIDGDASREMGLLASQLCTEIKRSLQLPLFVWMTAEGNPVAWIPASHASPQKVVELFFQSHEMVSRMWTEDSAYVMNNSRLDQARRRDRLTSLRKAKSYSRQPAVDAVSAVRRLAAMYDPFSRSFDGAGGLFPSGALELLSMAAIHPGLPDELRAKCRETVANLLTDLLPSPLFDPLDGGVFSSRVGKTWALPGFYRDCSSQARAGCALLSAYRATGEPQALEKVMQLIRFTENAYRTPEGLFAAGLAGEPNPAAWMWTVEDFQKNLPAEEAAWWINATDMKALGNLPPEADVRKDYFRSNTLGLRQSIDALAAGFGQPPDTFRKRFETAREKLLAVRNARLGNLPHDDNSHAVASFRMVSLYAAAYSVTGDELFREKAVSLIEKCRRHFSDGPRLRIFSQDAAPSLAAGRTFLYGLAIQAAMDVSVISFDDSWLEWSEELATTAAELFTSPPFLRECPDDASLADVPIMDDRMLFDDTSVGLFSMAECRLARAGRPLLPSLSGLVTSLPVDAIERPVLYTDLLQAALARHFKVILIHPEHLPEEMKTAIAQLPFRLIQHRVATKYEEVPAGAVKVVSGDAAPRLMNNPATLQQAVLPSVTK